MTTYHIEYDTSAGPEDSEAGRVWDVVRRDQFGATFTVSTGSYEADAQMIVNHLNGFELVEMWQVRGIHGQLYATKIEAERVARGVFPDEDPDTRYGRIFFSRYYRESMA